MNCALSIANQGHEVHLVEKNSELGGIARKIHSTLDGLDVQEYLSDLITKVYQHRLIHVYHDATITGATGYVGNFVTSVKSEQRIHRHKTRCGGSCYRRRSIYAFRIPLWRR